MCVADFYVFVEPSIYHARKRIIRVLLDLGRHAEMNYRDFEALLRRILSLFPELGEYEFERRALATSSLTSPSYSRD